MSQIPDPPGDVTKVFVLFSLRTRNECPWFCHRSRKLACPKVKTTNLWKLEGWTYLFFLRPEWSGISMLTAEKQVSQVPGCSITQVRYSQPHLILFLWHPPALWDAVTLNPSAFSNAQQTHSGQDSCDISVSVCKRLLDLKVSVCWVLGT